MEWSDGSLQLLIGNEVLDISKQDAQHEQAHLFLRHGKVSFSLFWSKPSLVHGLLNLPILKTSGLETLIH